jgi:small subunit ribosomal protein S6
MIVASLSCRASAYCCVEKIPCSGRAFGYRGVRKYTERSAVLYYETIFIVNPDISQENTEKLTDDLVAKVEKIGGRIVKRENHCQP